MARRKAGQRKSALGDTATHGRKRVRYNMKRASLAHRHEANMLGRIFKGIKAGLAKTRGVFAGALDLLRGKGKVDQAFLDELEKRLYLADVGTQATHLIVDRVRQAFRDKEITGEVEEFVKKQLRELLADASPGINYQATGPTVVMIAGVNGSGKTASIAKLAEATSSLKGRKCCSRRATPSALRRWSNSQSGPGALAAKS